MLKKSIVNFCPKEYSGDEVEADSFGSRLFPPRLLLLLLLLLLLFYKRKVESRFAADQDPADGFRGASYRECGYGTAWDQPCRRSPPASPTSVDFPLNLNRALITLFTFSEKRSNESQSRSRSRLLPKKSLINGASGKRGGLLRVWEPGTCVLGFYGFQPPTPTFNGTHQSREIQAEGNFFAMFASSGIVA